MRAIIDLLAGLALFTAGVTASVKCFGRKDRLAFTVVALLSPCVALFAVLRVGLALVSGKNDMEPCPPGLMEAEKLVELQRQKLFGGSLREPSFSKRWQTAYDREIQRDAARVREIAARFLVMA